MDVKHKWNFGSARKLAWLKVFYDFGGAILAFVLAFFSRFVLLHLEQTESAVMAEVAHRYLDLFTKFVFPFSFITVGGLAILGFYRAVPSASAKAWRPLFIVAATSLGPIAWSLFMYYTLSANGSIFPRGVTLFAWFYTVAFLAGPRIAKYYLLRRLVVEVHHHRRDKIKNVLVIGGAGYIGSQLTRELIGLGYRVRILDLFLFGDASIQEIRSHSQLDVLVGDFRNVETVARAVSGMDAVIHLGGIVGDPACSVDDDFTVDTNLTATVMLAEVCKTFKIDRFIFASSCSVYGASSNSVLTEESPLNPVSLYAKTKIASENVLLQIVGDKFCPTILRFGTLFGLSPRPRFDLFVNLSTAEAVREGKIKVFGGHQWRPFVHVRDVAKAIVAVLQAPVEKIRGEIFNVGDESNCKTIEQVAQRVAALVPGVTLDYRSDVIDARDYRVSFQKLRNVLGVRLETSIDFGIEELRNALADGGIKDHTEATYSNVKRTQILLTEPDKGDNVVGLNEIRARRTAKTLLSEVNEKTYA